MATELETAQAELRRAELQLAKSYSADVRSVFAEQARVLRRRVAELQLADVDDPHSQAERFEFLADQVSDPQLSWGYRQKAAQVRDAIEALGITKRAAPAVTKRSPARSTSGAMLYKGAARGRA